VVSLDVRLRTQAEDEGGGLGLSSRIYHLVFQELQSLLRLTPFTRGHKIRHIPVRRHQWTSMTNLAPAVCSATQEVFLAACDVRLGMLCEKPPPVYFMRIGLTAEGTVGLAGTPRIRNPTHTETTHGSH
jgi:hypothetical protein